MYYSKLLIIFMIFSLLLIGCGIKAQEYTFKQNFFGLNKYIEKATPQIKKEIVLKKSYFFSKYISLPKNEKERGIELGKLNQDLYKYTTKLKEESTNKVNINKEMFEKNMKNVFSNFVGDWKAVGMNLVITHDGSVYYKKYKSGWKKEINGTFKEFKGNTFIIKVLWIFPVTFRIDEPPHKSDNKWKMRIDGVELTKML